MSNTVQPHSCIMIIIIMIIIINIIFLYCGVYLCKWMVLENQLLLHINCSLYSKFSHTTVHFDFEPESGHL